MTSFSDRPNSALVVVDVQNDVVAKAHRRDDVIANINALVDKARAEQVPVIWVQHSDDGLAENSDGWRYVPELQRRQSEPVVHKHYGDSFEDTTLESELAQRAVGRLVVTGAQTDACIRATFTVPSCAVTTRSWSAMPTPPRTCPNTGCRRLTR